MITAVADPYGALMRDLAVPVLDKNPEDMTTYEALIRHFVYRQRVTADDHAIASRAVELAVERDPGNADLWAALAFSFMEGYKNRYHEQENAARRALQCARRAIEIDPRSAYAQYALFETSFFNQDVPAAKQAALRALELNPRDTDAMAMIGILNGKPALSVSTGRESLTRTGRDGTGSEDFTTTICGVRMSRPWIAHSALTCPSTMLITPNWP